MKNTPNLFGAGIKIAGLTLISRVFGLIRELLIAQIFGVGTVSDAINIAFKLPNLFRRIFAEGALSSVFVPIFNAKLLDSKNEAKKFTGQVFGLLLITLIILIVLMQIAMPSLMLLIAPGFYQEKEKFELTILLCRITMPYLILVSVTAFFGSILNSISKFAAFAFFPVILNAAIILACLVKFSNLVHSAIYICWFLIIAGILHTVFMFFCLKSAKLTFPVTMGYQDKDVKKLLKNMVPATISAGTVQLNLFISQTIASFIPGAVSILAYADRIYQFPLSIIGISFGTILLPQLSKIYKLADFNLAHKLQNKAIKLAMLISMPASFGIGILSVQIIDIIYQRGAFNKIDTLQTAEVLSAFAFGLPAFILTKILTPIFYANHDTKTPLKITICTMGANILLNLGLMYYFKYIGIALGSSIAAWINVWLLYIYAKKQANFLVDYNIMGFCFKILLCCLTMTAFLLLVNHYYGAYYDSDDILTKILTLGSSIFSAIIIFSISALSLGIHRNLELLTDDKDIMKSDTP